MSILTNHRELQAHAWALYAAYHARCAAARTRRAAASSTDGTTVAREARPSCSRSDSTHGLHGVASLEPEVSCAATWFPMCGRSVVTKFKGLPRIGPTLTIFLRGRAPRNGEIRNAKIGEFPRRNSYSYAGKVQKLKLRYHSSFARPGYSVACSAYSTRRYSRL